MEEKEKVNKDQESPSEETTNKSEEDQANQPIPPASEDTSTPEDKKRRTSGARKLRDLVAESLNPPGWSVVRKLLNNLEDTLENQDDDEGGKPKA